MLKDIKIREGTVRGFGTYTLDNGIVSLVMIPSLGGKISSLKDLRNGREWLWTNPMLPYKNHTYGTSYISEADTGGWDECFPTVAACNYPLPPWQNIELPDHGEIWSQAWRTEIEETVETISILGEVRGVRIPYLFSRTVTLSKGSDILHFHYCVKNTGDTSIAFIWSAHPLLAIEPGMRLNLPSSSRLTVNLSIPPAIFAHSNLSWPLEANLKGKALGFAELPGTSTGIAFKIWSQPLQEGWAELAAPDGTLCFRFEPTVLPQIGVWLNAGAWSGASSEPYYNLGLEPCIGAQDSLEDAVHKHNLYATLASGEERHWELKVQLTAAKMPEQKLSCGAQ